MSQDRYDTFLKQVGMNIRRVRKEQGLSMEDVAHEANIEYRQIGRIERGEISTTITSLQKIAEAMQVEIREFFTFEQSTKK